MRGEPIPSLEMGLNEWLYPSPSPLISNEAPVLESVGASLAISVFGTLIAAGCLYGLYTYFSKPAVDLILGQAKLQEAVNLLSKQLHEEECRKLGDQLDLISRTGYNLYLRAFYELDLISLVEGDHLLMSYEVWHGALLLAAGQ